MSLRVMRDVLIGKIHEKMLVDDNIFFLSADFGSPALDKLRAECEKRFINVGIAEQNLVNIATGLALEGCTVYAYAIAPFLTMRAYEQTRNLALLSQTRKVNINLIGVGAGLSYDVTGPTHHCLEDICIMRILPNVVIFSPSDYVVTEMFVDYSLNVQLPKYIRLEGRVQPRIYNDGEKISIEQGFSELEGGDKVVIVSTGYMTHKALKIMDMLKKDGAIVGVIDIFMLKPVNEVLLCEALKKYSYIYTMEEGFVNKGGLDSIIINILNNIGTQTKLTKFGFSDRYVFEVGNREYLHMINGLDEENIIKIIKKDVVEGYL